MAVPLTPDDATKLVTKLLDLYATAEADLLARITASVEKGIDEPEWAHRQLLELQRFRREAQATLADLSKKAQLAGGTAVGSATNQGAAYALADLNSAMTPPAPITATPVNLEAVSALAADLARVTSTTNATVLRSVDDIYRRVVADMTTQELLGTASRRELAEKALARLARGGITGFVDKAGRKWEMTTYIESASRAATMNATIEGHAQQLQAQGRDLVMISDVPQECAKCRPWEGRIVSLGGAVAGSITPDGKKVAGSLAQARAEGLFHVNCRHSLAAYFPGVTKGFGETADPQGDKDRQRLRLLERRVRAAKREELLALTPEGVKAASAKVRALQAQIREHVETTTAKRQPHRERINAAR